jgi:hypothetical protein
MDVQCGKYKSILHLRLYWQLVELKLQRFRWELLSTRVLYALTTSWLIAYRYSFLLTHLSKQHYHFSNLIDEQVDFMH